MTKKAIKEAFKEVLRLVVFALPGILIQVITSDPELSAQYGGLILLVLRALDKGIHEDKSVPVKGILPF